MNLDQYDISYKPFLGWTTISFKKFTKRYKTIGDRKKLIANTDKSKVYDKYVNRRLSLEESLKLLGKYEFSICKTVDDWNEFILHYEGICSAEDYEKAVNKVKELLFNDNLGNSNFVM